jgi:RNA polymerase sigma-70 factor (ECF subfamily)
VQFKWHTQRYTVAVQNDYPIEPQWFDEYLSMTDWEKVVGQHVGIVQRTVHRLVGNYADAWDCIQDTFLEAVKIDRREPIRNWSALLRHLATAKALDLLRKRSRLRARCNADSDPAEAVSREPNPTGHAEASELADRLRVAVGQLPSRQAQVFCLTCFEQMSSEEVAERLQINATAVRMLLCRARERLRRLLEPLDGASERDD